MNNYNNNNFMDNRRSSLMQSPESVLSPPLTPSIAHSYDKRNEYYTNRYSTMDHYWINNQHHLHMQQQQQQQMLHQQQMIHQQQQQQIPSTTTTTTTAIPKSPRKQPSKQNKHMCTFPECLWSFKRFEHLKRHMLVHTGERPHVCPHPGCGKRFSRSDNFHAHYRTHEKKAFARQQKNLVQQQQQQESTTNAEIHHYYQPPPSYPLLATAMNYNQVQQHYTTNMDHHLHSPIPTTVTRPAFNTPCSSSSTSSSSSTNTKRKSNITAKSHACSHLGCDRRFRRLEHLKRHMRIHTHEQPFKCNYPGCLKAFSRSDNLTQHKKTHEKSNKLQEFEPTGGYLVDYGNNNTSWHESTETVHC